MTGSSITMQCVSVPFWSATPSMDTQPEVVDARELQFEPLAHSNNNHHHEPTYNDKWKVELEFMQN